MKHIAPYLIIAVLVYVFGFLHAKRIYDIPPPPPKITVITTTHIDTIPAIYEPTVIDLGIDNYVIEDSIYYYNIPFEDSLITGTSTIVSEGLVKSHSFSYTPLFPQYVVRTDSVFTEKVTTITEVEYRYRQMLFGGLELGSTPDLSIDVSLQAGYQFKSGKAMTYRYSIPTKTHFVGFTVPIL